MRLPRVRLTVRRLMIVVAVAGGCMVVFRLHPALGALLAGVSAMSLIRTFGAIDRSRATRQPMRSAAIVRTSIASALIASAILVACLLPSLCILPIINRPRMHETPRVHTEDIVGIVVAALLAIPIATLLRRRLW